MPSTPDDPSDAIAAALARLRGRRGPRPPWMEGVGPHSTGPHAHGPAGPHGHSGDGGEHVHADGTMHGSGGRGPWGRGGPGPGFGAPPWAGGGGRFGGPARMRLLEALAAASHPLSVGEIADAVGVDQPRASRLVQQSVELDLVRREADPDDARRTRVALTDAGTRLVRGFRGERREAIDSALAAFTDEERAELARLLTKLADSWPGA
ncbi:MarR family winged helix-turn-helix transcriptional regulator [Microbacterium trichothecenolyticum]|uniref:Transcriptional regulator SlyA n=1 Tax=Microbacterium trichothecenolyticum TaxID=69370 RepID=A0A0M2HDC7_MICTR|nr:MarR family winged helix-turn-helix transcriptional regulator [Microbacterium trichothecenolyticum]KJL42241.1 Transcriptional regulator SlyA [Microbacterium trichothecenolyticum]